MPPLKISKNKPLFRLFSELVKSNNSKDIQKNLQRFKPYMSKSDYSLISKFASVFSGFLGSNYIKGELNSNKDADLAGLFKEMVEKCLASGLKSPIVSVVEQLEKDVTNEELKKTRDDFLGVVKNSCQHRMCENFASLFADIENRDVETGLKEIEDLTNQGNLDETAMKSVLENHPSLLVHAFNESFPEGLTPQQTYLSRHLILAFAPLRTVLNQTYTSGQSKVKLEASDYRELADKLLYSFNYDPISFNKKLYNPITQDLRDMFSDAMYTVTTTIPKSIPGVTLTSTEAIGSASLSDNGAFDFKTTLDKVNDDTLAVRNAQLNYILFDLDIVSSFANDQKELTVEQRAFWVHNFLAALIFEEDGREYDKSIDKIEKDAPDAIQPGAKILRLLKKHAKALSYMIKDPLALNTLPSVIKPQVEALVKQIRESGLEILVDKNTDIFTDRQLENGANFIKALLNFDINKANSDLTPKQLELKLSLISAEKTLEDSVDTILENVSEMINSPEEVPEQKVQAEPVAQEGESANGEAVNAENGNAQNPPVDNGDMSDPLNPNSTLKSLNDSSGNKDDVMTQFVTNVRKNYFNKLSKMDKLSMVSASIRYSRADKKGFISTDKMIGSAFKGAGPIMQKMLQKPPQKEISEELKKSFSDMKSNLAPIPEAVVQAHLLQIVNNSDGKVKKIEIQRSLGAASVGEAFLCKVYTADKPEGVDCVIKILRPDVMNKAHRELEIFREAAKNIPGMDVTFEGSLKSIMEELDLTIEAQNIISGQVYNNFDPNVQSMKLFDLVPPSTDVLIIEKAPGVTVNCVINSLENKVLDDILKPVTKIESRIPGLESKAQYTSIEGFLAETDEITPSESDFVDMHSKLLTEYKDLIEQRNNLVKFSKEWFSQGIFETGFYHGDLHAGNIMTSKDKLTVIDFGNCIKLKPYQQENIIRMMAASIDSNGQAFMLGLKNLLSEKSLQRLSEVKDYNGVQMTVEQHLTDVISAILKKGNENDTGLRIKLAIEAILKEGIEIPAPIYNFELSQLSLQNTIDEMNSQIDSVRKLFLKLGLIRGDTKSNSLCPTASFAKKAVKIFINIEKKDQSKALLKLYNEELDKLLKDPEENLKRKVKYVGALTFSMDFWDQTDSVKNAFCFMDDPKFKYLYEKWQGPRLENENKTNKKQEITLAEQKAEDEAFDEFFSYYKEKVTVLMQQEFETLKNFLEEKNKGEVDFLTGMSEVLLTYKWDAVKTLGTMTSIKYGINSLFA